VLILPYTRFPSIIWNRPDPANRNGVQFDADDLFLTDSNRWLAPATTIGAAIVRFTVGPGERNHARNSHEAKMAHRSALSAGRCDLAA
jgi:hypothetical protein